MQTVAQHVWLIPLLPLIAAGILAFTPARQRRLASTLAIGAMVAAFVLSLAAAFGLAGSHEPRIVTNGPWFVAGQLAVHWGWMVDPLSAAMVVMITFVGSLIFLFSTGYMAEDPHYSRFFGFLSLFAAAMLGLVLANSLLVLFVCWELVGLASYLLIGFWFHKPSAAAAAKKAFLTTRIGDLGLFTGLILLNQNAGTLLCYDAGRGCLESGALTSLADATVAGGLTLSAVIGLLCFWGAMGKSGQLPLHVWLPDAMEGPTPVSALIHAATMVAAGVFLIARLFPLLSAVPLVEGGTESSGPAPALIVVAWVGAVTALFGALCAVAQNDLKRILAYSTMSQLGLMFVGVATGGPAVGMTHLITHACFKALLFLGAGSVIHACHHEQDIRRLGGLRHSMPWTFATYAIGMMALAGVPVVFSGFWSKDAILHSALEWPISKGPFVLSVLCAVLTAFYMTRQVCFVFLGQPRAHSHGSHASLPYESPAVMTRPLAILAFCTIALSAFCTPFWPALENALKGLDQGEAAHASGLWGVLILSTVATTIGIGFAAWIYRKVRTSAEAMDPLTARWPRVSGWLRHGFGLDALYRVAITGTGRLLGIAAAGLDRWIWHGLVDLARTFGIGAGWLSRRFDEQGLNGGFDQACDWTRNRGLSAARFHNGQAPRYLRMLTVGLTVVVLAVVGWMKR